MVNTWLNKNSQRAWIREWREGRVQEGRYVDTSHHLAEDQAIRGSNDKSGISCDGTGAMIGLTKLDYQQLRLPQWDEMMGNEEKSKDGDSIRMLTYQVKKYLKFAETKT